MEPRARRYRRWLERLLDAGVAAIRPRPRPEASTPWVVTEANPPEGQALDRVRLFAVLGTWMEEDIVEASVRNAVTQGCERVYLVDNDSPDRTVETARREGAVLARSFRTDHYDETVRIRLMNDVVAEVSAAEGEPHIWWLWLDADEFAHGPRGLTLREYLVSLDRRFRIVGTRYFNHYPGPPPHYEPGRHPLDFQPLCEELRYPMCGAGHRKHPLQRYDRDGQPIEGGVGFHTASSSQKPLLEPLEPAFLHHFPFREERVCHDRLEALWRKNSDGKARAREDDIATGHMVARFRSLQSVYAQDWARVENFMGEPGSVGVRLRRWDELVDREHLGVKRWYRDPTPNR